MENFKKYLSLISIVTERGGNRPVRWVAFEDSGSFLAIHTPVPIL